MKSKRRLLRVTAVIAIALAAGHLAQSGQGSAGQGQAAVRGASVVPDFSSTVPVVTGRAGRADGGAPQLGQPRLIEAGLPVLPEQLKRPEVEVPERIEAPLDDTADSTSTSTPRDCTPLLGLSPRPGAMIDVLLSAPCRRDERVVLRHAGLAVTYRTNATGALFASLPALSADARVSILFAGGETMDARLSLPEAAEFRRFGVQWMGPQTFEVNAFENGADYGQPGHVSAATPQNPAQTMLPLDGFLSILGDATVDAPMLAQIYTFPGRPDAVPVLIEAEVTKATCGHEMLGDVLTADRGTVRMSDLSITMPGCDAIGDYLVLKNLAPDLKLASAN